MLKFLRLLPLVIILASCSKSSTEETNSTPAVVIQPDTLSAGWSRLTSNTTKQINDVFFTTPTNGFFCGDDGIYRSTDGGNSWTMINQNSAVNIAASGNTKGCFVDRNPVINVTSDGVTFSQANHLGIDNLGFTDAFYSSSNICYISSGKYIWKSTDGGNNFDTLYNFQVSSDADNTLYFVNDQLGWINRGGLVFRTTNGGVSWTQQSTGTSGNGVDFVNTSVGFIGVDGAVLKTTDCGATFVPIFSNLPGPLIDIAFLDANTGYISSGNKIYKTTDG